MTALKWHKNVAPSWEFLLPVVVLRLSPAKHERFWSIEVPKSKSEDYGYFCRIEVQICDPSFLIENMNESEWT